MPQLTLSFNTPNRQLSLSPQKPKVSALSISNKGQQPDLRRLHHEEEDMAAGSRSRAKAMAEGKTVPMNDDPEDAKFDQEAGDGEGGKGKREINSSGRAKGAPTNKKRSRSPEGGGVAGNQNKKHKNAYEISMFTIPIISARRRVDASTEGKIATAEDAARVDKDPPLDQLMRLLKADAPKTEKGESVVYWMRMEDMRGMSTRRYRRNGIRYAHLGSRGQYSLVQGIRICKEARNPAGRTLCSITRRLQMAR